VENLVVNAGDAGTAVTVGNLGLTSIAGGKIVFNGGAGADTVDASAFGGPTELRGGAGNDTLIGGGDDLFIFADSAGDDTIDDFVVGTDSLSLLDGLTVASVSDTDADGDTIVDATLVTFGSGDTVTLLGLTGLIEDNLFV